MQLPTDNHMNIIKLLWWLTFSFSFAWLSAPPPCCKTLKALFCQNRLELWLNLGWDIRTRRNLSGSGGADWNLKPPLGGEEEMDFFQVLFNLYSLVCLNRIFQILIFILLAVRMACESSLIQWKACLFFHTYVHWHDIIPADIIFITSLKELGYTTILPCFSFWA